ncbi:MAG: hypothetical protein WC560_11140 [Syntrophales bacterium]
MKYFFARAILVVFFACCIGCSHVENYYNDIVKEKGISKEYIDVLNKWTRSETVYSQFETKVHISATYKVTEFNNAYLNEYARIYHLTDAEKKIRNDMQMGLASYFTEFLFYASTPENQSNDFSGQDSIWTIFVLDENGNRIDPAEVRKIEKITSLITVFYPYFNQYYGMFYSLKFPSMAGLDRKSGDIQGKQIKLVFVSVLGRVELEWK